MHLTASPWILLTAIAFLVPWAALHKAIRARAYHLACQVLRLYLQRRDKATVIVYTGTAPSSRPTRRARSRSTCTAAGGRTRAPSATGPTSATSR